MFVRAPYVDTDMHTYISMCIYICMHKSLPKSYGLG